MNHNLAAVLADGAVSLPWLILLAVAAARRGPGWQWIAAGAVCTLLSFGMMGVHFAQELAFVRGLTDVRGYLNRPGGWVLSLASAPLLVAGWGLFTPGVRAAWRARDGRAAVGDG